MWQPRRYREGDEKGIVTLLKTVFQEWQGEPYWYWMYKDRPCKEYSIIWVAEQAGSIIGHYALVPVTMCVDGSKIRGSQSVDTATHPRFRGRGIFQTLANLAYSDAQRQGVVMSYGFSVVGDPAYVGFTRKLGWKHVGMMLSGARVLNYYKLIHTIFEGHPRKDLDSYVREAMATASSGLSTTVSDYEVRSLCDFGGFETVAELSGRLGHVLVERSVRYLTWRYVNKPASRYIRLGCFRQSKPVGYLVLGLRAIGNRMDGHIVDLVGDGEKAVHVLMRAAVSLLRTKVATLSVLIQEWSPYIEILRSAGFRFKQSRLPLIVRVNDPAVISEDRLVDPARWFIMHGDSDQV